MEIGTDLDVCTSWDSMKTVFLNHDNHIYHIVYGAYKRKVILPSSLLISPLNHVHQSWIHDVLCDKTWIQWMFIEFLWRLWFPTLVFIWYKSCHKPWNLSPCLPEIKKDFPKCSTKMKNYHKENLISKNSISLFNINLNEFLIPIFLGADFSNSHPRKPPTFKMP